MALPTTISGTAKFAAENYYCGPFLSGGNVYVVVSDTTSAKIHVYKATDPTSSFSEMDSANVPAQVGVNLMICARQDGTTLSIAAGDQQGSPAYKFHQFSMATDTWSATIKDKAIASPAVGVGSLFMVKRSDGSFVVLLNGVAERLMATDFDRVAYVTSTDGGATWSAETAVAATGVKRNMRGSMIVLGASDRAHFFYSDTTANAKHRSLSSGNALDTEAAVVTTIGTALNHNYCPGVSYVSGANTVVKVPVNAVTAGRLSNVVFNSGANPTIAVEANYSDATVKAINNTLEACHALDGTTTHSAFSDATTQDLMHDKETDGGSWGTDVNEWTATINRVSANIYTRSGNLVLAVLVDDGGTVKYNEISLAAAAGSVAYAPNQNINVTYPFAGAGRRLSRTRRRTGRWARRTDAPPLWLLKED